MTLCVEIFSCQTSWSSAEQEEPLDVWHGNIYKPCLLWRPCSVQLLSTDEGTVQHFETNTWRKRLKSPALSCGCQVPAVWTKYNCFGVIGSLFLCLWGQKGHLSKGQTVLWPCRDLSKLHGLWPTGHHHVCSWRCSPWDLQHKYVLFKFNQCWCCDQRTKVSYMCDCSCLTHVHHGPKRQTTCFQLFLLFQTDWLWLQQPLHTWECPVCSEDPPVQQTAASLLSLLDDCSSGPALSDGRGWISELRPEKHSLPLWSDSLTGCKHTQQHTWRSSEGPAVSVKSLLSQCRDLIGWAASRGRIDNTS